MEEEETMLLEKSTVFYDKIGSSTLADIGQMHQPDFPPPSKSWEFAEFCRKDFDPYHVRTNRDLQQQPRPTWVASHPLYGFVPAWDSLPLLPLTARHQRVKDRRHPEGLFSTSYHLGQVMEDTVGEPFGPMDCEPAGHSSPDRRSHPGRHFNPGEQVVFSGATPRYLAGFGQYRHVGPSTDYLLSPEQQGLNPGSQWYSSVCTQEISGPCQDMRRDSQPPERPADEQAGRAAWHPGLSDLHCYQPVRLPESPVRLPDLAATRIRLTEPLRDYTLGSLHGCQITSYCTVQF